MVDTKTDATTHTQPEAEMLDLAATYREEIQVGTEFGNSAVAKIEELQDEYLNKAQGDIAAHTETVAEKLSELRVDLDQVTQLAEVDSATYNLADQIKICDALEELARTESIVGINESPAAALLSEIAGIEGFGIEPITILEDQVRITAEETLQSGALLNEGELRKDLVADPEILGQR